MPNAKVIRKLNDLIELDFDAIEAYQAAIERLQSPTYRRKLKEFMTDHQRHTRKLSARVEEFGGAPARGPDLMRYLTKGQVLFAKLIAGDRAILMAMRVNEEVTNRRYELALAVNGMDAETRRLVEENLDDERRHREWISAQLERRRASPRVARTPASARRRAPARKPRKVA